MNIDPWSVLFQIVNFALLVYILKRLLFNPVRSVIRKRNEQIENRLKEAERRTEESERVKARYEEEKRKLAEQKDRLIEQMHEEISRERKRLISEAEDNANRILVRQRAAIEHEKGRLEQELDAAAIESATEYARGLLRDIADEAVHMGFVSRLLKDLGHISSEIQALVAEQGGPRGELKVEVASAFEPREDDIGTVKAALDGEVGVSVSVSVRKDPSLIAGMRLKAMDRLYDFSAAGQIEVFRKRVKNTLPAGEQA